MIFDKQQLIKAIQSDIEVIAIWGAFQILKLNDKEMTELLPYFLQSPFEEIQDAGVAKIAELKLEGFEAELLGIFRKAEGQLKFTAAYALSDIPNDISKSQIQRWFEMLVQSDQSTRLEFDAAAYAYINLAREENYPKVQKSLIGAQNDSIKSSVLFTNLLIFGQSELDFAAITDHYFVIRDRFSDAELTHQLVDYLVPAELREWWMKNLSKGFSISSVYEQCYQLLGIENNLMGRQYWYEIEKAVGGGGSLYKNTPEDTGLFIETVCQWSRQIIEAYPESKQKRLLWVVEGFLRHELLFDDTIPKIIELEVDFLLSVPLFILLEQAFTKWLQDPARYVENIANYYHSTLLIKDFREEILSMFFPSLPEWSDEEVRIVHDTSPVGVNDNKNSILWAFYRGELLGYHVPWPSIFPNPDYSLHLSKGLAKIYTVNFNYFVENQDKVSVDYALQLFQLNPSKDRVLLLALHFNYLYQHHTETLYQTIEYLPDSAFLEYLLKKYKSGEMEIARLIFLISEIFDLPIPSEAQKDIEALHESGFRISGVKKPVRLFCNACGSTFQYPVETIYIDEGSIMRLNRLTEDSIWVPYDFTCKNCQADLPFSLDTVQMDELTQQSRVDRILKITPQTKDQQFGYQTCLIDFPRHDGKTYTPGAYQELMSKIGKDSKINDEELKQLWMKQARLKKAMSQWEECKQALEVIRSLEKIDEEWMFLMGFVNYKLALFADARKYFAWILKKYPDDMPLIAFTPYVEKSKYYLNLLDSKASKRARFKVITRKK